MASAAQLRLAITPSSAWTAAHVEHVSSCIQQRNRYVSQQLVTMVKEQHAKVKAAAAAAGLDAAADLHAAQFVFLATLTCPTTNSVLAAALFYPRAGSGRAGADCCNMPHVYVELLCCNCPGKGIGRLLLQHIEDFVAANADDISLFDVPAGGVEAAAAVTEAAAVPGTAGPRRSYSSLPVLLPDSEHSQQLLPNHTNMAGLALSASSSSSSSGSLSSLASSAGSSITSTASGSTAEGASTELRLSCDCGGTAALSLAAAAEAAAAAAASGHDDQGSSAGGAATQQQVCSSCRLIQGIKLLSVQSAQGFYAKCGYGQPDSHSEMFKEIKRCSPLAQPGGGSHGVIAAQAAVLPARTPAF